MYPNIRRLCLLVSVMVTLISAVASAQTGSPVQFAGGGEIPAGQATTPIVNWRVPTGKRLIIEFVGLVGAVPDDQKVSAVVSTSVGGFRHYYQFYPTAYPTNPSFRTDSVLNQQVRLYADGDTDVVMWGGRVGNY